jgi:hypothetical protein
MGSRTLPLSMKQAVARIGTAAEQGDTSQTYLPCGITHLNSVSPESAAETIRPTAQPTGDQGAGVRGVAELWEGRLTRPSGSRLRHRQPTGPLVTVRCHDDVPGFDGSLREQPCN